MLMVAISAEKTSASAHTSGTEPSAPPRTHRTIRARTTLSTDFFPLRNGTLASA